MKLVATMWQTRGTLATSRSPGGTCWLGARASSPNCKTRGADLMEHWILCYGDSNTYGYDLRSCLGGRYPENVRWTARLQSEGWTVFNEGQNGCSIPQSSWDVETLVQTLRRQEPEITTVMLGTNDLLQSSSISAADCAERMERFLNSLLEQKLSCQFLLIAPPPVALGAWVDDPRIVETSRRLGAHYQATAQKLGISFADAKDWNVELAYDGVHFSESGHRAFSDGIGNSLLGLAGGAS